MTRYRVKSNLRLAGFAALLMVTGCWMIQEAPGDAFALLGLTIALVGFGLASIVAWKVSL